MTRSTEATCFPAVISCGMPELKCALSPARMQLLEQGAGDIQPIDPVLGKEAHDWVLRPKRNTIAFKYYARRSLKLAHNQDCLMS